MDSGGSAKLMREYLCKVGRTVYLVNLDTDEGYTFNSFGDPQGLTTGKLGYANSRSQLEVDLLSFLGESCVNVSEIYFQGEVGVVNVDYMTAYQKLKDIVPKADYLVYRVKHDEGAIQILVPCKKNMLTKLDIEKTLGTVKWSKLSNI